MWGLPEVLRVLFLSDPEMFILAVVMLSIMLVVVLDAGDVVGEAGDVVLVLVNSAPVAPVDVRVMSEILLPIVLGNILSTLFAVVVTDPFAAYEQRVK